MPFSNNVHHSSVIIKLSNSVFSTFTNESGICILLDFSQSQVYAFSLSFANLFFGDKSQLRPYFIDERFDNGVLSFVPTVDYYWKENRFRPYVGIGLGYHIPANPIEVMPNGANFSETVIDGSVKKRIGFLVRGGVELGKLRISVEYNLVPKAAIEIPNDEIVGTVDNSYFGLSIGFMIRPGKSSK